MRVVPSPSRTPLTGSHYPTKWWQDWFNSIADILQGVWGNYQNKGLIIEGVAIEDDGSASTSLVQMGKAYFVSIVWTKATLTSAAMVIPARTSAGSITPTTLRPGNLLCDVDGVVTSVAVGGTSIALPDVAGDRVSIWGMIVPEEN